MDIFLLYLFTRLDSLGKLLAVTASLGIVLSIIATVSYCIWYADYSGSLSFERLNLGAKKVCKGLIISTIVLALLSVATPSKKDVVFIVAGKIGLDIVQSDTIAELSNDLKETVITTNKVFKKYLNEYLVEED